MTLLGNSNCDERYHENSPYSPLKWGYGAPFLLEKMVHPSKNEFPNRVIYRAHRRLSAIGDPHDILIILLKIIIAPAC